MQEVYADEQVTHAPGGIVTFFRTHGLIASAWLFAGTRKGDEFFYRVCSQTDLLRDS